MFSDTDNAGENRRIDRESESLDRSRSVRASRRARLRRGAEGGALATLVMTAYRLPVRRSLPPTAKFWATYVSDGDPGDHPVPALALHFAYGVGAGALFAAVLPSRESVSGDVDRPGPPSPSGEIATTVLGLCYGLALSAFGDRVVLGELLDTDPVDRFAFHVSHALYGITLGSWVGTRTRDDGG